MNHRAFFATVALLALHPSGSALAQTDLRTIERTTLVLEGDRLYRREASGRLALLANGRYLLPGQAEVTIALGRVSRFECVDCPQTATETIDGSMFKTKDSECALEYTAIYKPVGQLPMFYPPKIVKWAMGTRLSHPVGAPPESYEIKIYLVKNLSSLRLIHLKPYGVAATQQLSVGEQSGVDSPSAFDRAWVEWGDCGEPDPVVVAAREEKHKTALVAAAVRAVRAYLAAR